MELDFAFICDYAEVSNKINALGIGFDTIFAQSTPVTHGSFHLVAQFRAEPTEVGQKRITLSIIDADGKAVINPAEAAITIGPPAPGSYDIVARVSIAFGSVTFPRFGAYSLHADVEGQEMVRIPLRVAKSGQQK
ncbi:MAG: hypothetical protein FJ039_04105 [Chloroflexi bacterium]|nr:hypothetical protein [Chloroflexota bacterium]